MLLACLALQLGAVATASDGACDAASGACAARGPLVYGNGTRFWQRDDGLFAAPLPLEPCEGGWRCVKDAADSPLLQPVRPPDGAEPARGRRSFCDIDVVKADDAERLGSFESAFRNKAPVLVRSHKKHQAWLGKGKKARVQRAKFGREKLLARVGKDVGSAGLSHDMVKAAGNGYVPFSLRDFARKFMAADASEDTAKGEPFYVFQRGSSDRRPWAADPASLLTPPPGNPDLFPKPLPWQNVIWMMGPPRSGTAFHAHTEAWTALAHGRKRWLFYPPDTSPPAGGSGPDTYPSESSRPPKCLLL